MYTIALRLDPETRYKLEQLARATGRTRASLVAEAVGRFVDAELTRLVAEGKKEQPDQDGNSPDTPERWNLIV